MKSWIVLLLALFVFGGCSFDPIDGKCKKKLDEIRQRPRDPRLFGIWILEKDKERLKEDKDALVNFQVFRSDGHHRKASIVLELDRYVSNAWYTDKDTVTVYRCKSGHFQLFSKNVYKVEANTLKLYSVDEDTGDVSKSPWIYVRYEE
ncbi:hypothetical protein [Porphyromonas sp.]|uniref:hypothetical protein n=1 Tax=Porphyromonas sp. TaxID=1924944 RepID=UPI0026DCBE3D|nr:hypothetical protein [Porphyromonas sp.]MDO4695798.1 hypothetical protein [Porphyromonas sp.]MDO4771796.1 hypothetical protein [Porphyromonas sp.]